METDENEEGQEKEKEKEKVTKTQQLTPPLPQQQEIQSPSKLDVQLQSELNKAKNSTSVETIIKLNDKLDNIHGNNSNKQDDSNSPSKISVLPFPVRLFPETTDMTKSNFSHRLVLPQSAARFYSSPQQLLIKYDAFSRLRKWSAYIRDRICPPSSYSLSTRSSRTIIDAFSCIGVVSIALLRTDENFNKCISCEGNEEWRKAAYHNITQYKLIDNVKVQKDDFYHYFLHHYSSYSPLAVIYIDPSIPSLPTLTITNNNDDYIYSTPPIASTSTTLSSYISFLLYHSVHPVPLIIMKFPLEFDDDEFRKHIELVSNKGLLREWIKELNIGKNEGVKFIAIAANLNEISNRNSDSSINLSTNIKQYQNQPTAQSRRQMVYLHSQSVSTPHIYQRFKQLLASQLYKCYSAQTNLWEYVNQIINQEAITDDEQIYDLLREYYHKTLLMTEECKEIRERKLFDSNNNNNSSCNQTDGRANSRVTEISAFIKQHQFILPLKKHQSITSSSTDHCLLDVGCSEGSITASLASSLSLSRSNAHGCDVRELKLPSSITFSLITGETLPYPSNQFTIVCCLMSLHHIPNVKKSLEEIYRISQSGALLIIREHDLTSDPLAVCIDVMHGLYARVWSSPPEQPQFSNDYYASYKSRGQWKLLIESVGFKQCQNSPDRQVSNPVEGHIKRNNYHHYNNNSKVRRARGEGIGRGGNQEDESYIINPFEFYYGLYEKSEREESDISRHSSKPYHNDNENGNINRKKRSREGEVEDEEYELDKSQLESFKRHKQENDQPT